MMIHSGEKPFECDWPGCTKVFARKARKEIHYRSHVSLKTNLQTGDRPYLCKLDGCGKRFAERANLKAHLNVHKKRGVPESEIRKVLVPGRSLKIPKP